MRVFTDQVGRQITLLDAPPRRIVSLVPSQTELLASLGLDEEVVGITKFCIHPNHWFKSKKRIGGTKDVKIQEVLALQPDLIFANKEENEQGVLEILSQFAPVWVSDVRSLSDALQMIEAVGELTSKSQLSKPMAAEIAAGFASLPSAFQGKRVLYSIWYKPWMLAGHDTFIGSLLRLLGAELLVPAGSGSRYPEATIEEMKLSQPDLVLLSSEPFPFKQKHIDELKRGGIDVPIVLVEGDMFSWYGSRLVLVPAYLNALVKVMAS